MEQPTRHRRTARHEGPPLWRGLLWVVAALLLASAAPAAADETRRAAKNAPAAGNLVQVRVGNHPTYTRVVFEFDAPTGYRIERHAAGEAENTVVVTLQADSRARNIISKSQGVASVAVDPASGQAVARIVTRQGGLPIKEMILTDPPRVVLDLMLPESLRVAAAKPTPKPAPAAEPERSPSPSDTSPEDTTPQGARTAGVAEPPAVAPSPAPPVVAYNEPEAVELAPEPVVAVVEAEVAPEPAPAPLAVAQPDPIETAAPDAIDEGEVLVVADALTPPGSDALDELSQAAAEDAEEAALEAAEAALAEAAADVTEAAEVAVDDASMAAEDAELVDELSADDELLAETPPPPAPTALAVTPTPKTQATPAPGADTLSVLGFELDPITLGALAGGVLVLLLVLFMVLRGRRALPNDMDVTALAEAEGDDERIPAGGFSMEAPSSAMSDPAEDFEGIGYDDADDENKPIESAQAPVPGAGLFDDAPVKKLDDTPVRKEATTMDNQDMSMTQGTSEAPTHLGAGSGLAGMAGDSNVATLVQELERRMTLMEQRLEESNEARERLERQVSAQSEELRVQRAAIARTQRALRGLNRSEEDQATEPALRDPADPAGRQ